jgi:Flp pilus assembly protein TadD
MNKAVVAGVIAVVLLVTAGGGYWYYQKHEAEKAGALSHTVTQQSVTNPTMAVLAMLDAAKSENNAAILSAKVTLDSFPKPNRGDRKLARERNKLGLDALRANNYDFAISLLNEGVAADPSDVELKNNLGYALLMAVRLDDAKKALIESLVLDSARGAAWANLGQTLAKQGDEASAVAAFVNTFIFSRAQNKTIEYFTNLSQSDPDPRVKSAAAKFLETPLIKTGIVLKVPEAGR